MMISCIDNNDNDFFDETENQLCSNLSILHLVCAFDETYLLKHFLLFYGRVAVSRYEFKSVKLTVFGTYRKVLSTKVCL